MMDSRAEQRQQPTSPGTVALLESDSDLRRVVTAFLRTEGFEVLVLEGADEAELAVEAGRGGIVLLGGDFSALDRDGPVARIRRQRRGGLIPIVIMPSGPQPSEEERQVTADVVLPAPFQLGQLARALGALRSDGSFQRPPPDRPVRASDLRSPLAIPTSGILKGSTFSDVLGAVWRGAYTGVVGLKSGSTWRRIDFVNGFPIAARSNLLTEHLLRYLLRLGYISPEVYRQLLPTAQEQDWEAGLADLDSDQIDPVRLSDAKRKLAEEVVLQCLKWRGPTYRLTEQAPEPFDAIAVLNPFELYATWLADPTTTSVLNRSYQAIQAKGLLATPSLTENDHLLRSHLEALPPSAVPFDGTITAARLAALLGDDVRARAAVVSLVDLGVLKAAAAPLRVAIGDRRAEAPSGAGRKFERIRQMVAEDEGRVRRAEGPYAVLGVADGAAAAEVRNQYLRCSRFYRPENFERIGDDALLDVARELLGAFDAAATAILGERPDGPPMPLAKRLATQTTLSQDDLVLAEVFFDDGSTFLRLSDWREAQAHFERAHQLSRNTPRYITYLGWSTFQVDRKNDQNVRESKDLLLSALKLDSRDDRALFFLGCVYEETGRLERAIECWKKALRIDSSNFDARAALRRVTTG